MKILIITYFFPPVNSIASLRPYSWAKYWSKMGHDVTVLTTSKNRQDSDLNLDCSSFKILEIDNSLENKLRKNFRKDRAHAKEDKNQLEKISLKSKLINRVKTFLGKRGVFGFARMPDLNDFIINKSYISIQDMQYDLVISTAGPYSEHLIAKKLKQNNKTSFWIADYRDLWTQNHIFKGLFPFTLIEEYLEKKVNNSANMITTVSEPLADQIRNKYHLKNVETIENGFDFEDLETMDKEPYWNDKKIRLVYTGSIYKGKQDPSPLFESIRKIKNSNQKLLLENLEVIFVGGNKADLDELITKYGVSNWVSYGGFLPREDSLRMQRDAHALIFLEFEALGVDGILTGKLFEYICSGTEILGIGVTDKSTPGELIVKSGHGINFGKDSERIKEYLISLLQKGQRNSIEKNIEIIKKYSRKAQAEKILEFFKTIDKNRK